MAHSIQLQPLHGERDNVLILAIVLLGFKIVYQKQSNSTDRYTVI